MELINESEDRVLIINSGPEGKNTKEHIITIGMSLDNIKEASIVI